MNLEEINKEYLSLKKNLDVAKKETEKLKEIVELEVSDLAILNAEKNKAKILKNTSEEQRISKDIEAKKKIIEQAQKDAEKKAEEWKKIQEKIDAHIEEIKKDPNLKKHLDEVLVKKYDRQLKKVENEKKQLTDKKQRLTGLNELALNHKSVRSNIIGLTNAIKEINKLNEELKKLKQPVANGLFRYTDPTRANEITNQLLPLAKKKYENNRNLLSNYAKTQNLKIDDIELKELANKLSLNKGRIDIEGTINKEIKNIDKQIKGKDKSIANYKGAIQQFDDVVINNVQMKSSQNAEIEPKTGFFKKIFNRFKDWNNKRKQKSLPESEAEQSEVTDKTKKQKGEFVSSLKYDIVKDEVEKMQKDILKDAKAQRKNIDQEER